jgi:TatA/E family protein of Tat protein translocase
MKGIELFVIIFIAILIFGGKKLPELARSLAESMNEFKRAKNEGELESQIADAKRRELEKKAEDKA